MNITLALENKSGLSGCEWPLSDTMIVRRNPARLTKTAAVPSKSEKYETTLSPCSKLKPKESVQLQAVHHLRKLADAAKGLPSRGRLSKVF